jgi:hypothetical protein
MLALTAALIAINFRRMRPGFCGIRSRLTPVIMTAGLTQVGINSPVSSSREHHAYRAAATIQICHVAPRLCMCHCRPDCTSKAHPHDEPEILDVKSILITVDIANQIVEVDTIDNKPNARRNLLLFADRKVNIRDRKTRIALADLNSRG